VVLARVRRSLGADLSPDAVTTLLSSADILVRLDSQRSSAESIAAATLERTRGWYAGAGSSPLLARVSSKLVLRLGRPRSRAPFSLEYGPHDAPTRAALAQLFVRDIPCLSILEAMRLEESHVERCGDVRPPLSEACSKSAATILTAIHQTLSSPGRLQERSHQPVEGLSGQDLQVERWERIKYPLEYMLTMQRSVVTHHHLMIILAFIMPLIRHKLLEDVVYIMRRIKRHGIETRSHEPFHTLLRAVQSEVYETSGSTLDESAL
jgi:hypothetical protein